MAASIRDSLLGYLGVLDRRLVDTERVMRPRLFGAHGLRF
jgi:hypothetical protein